MSEIILWDGRMRTNKEYVEPWDESGVSRSTWFRYIKEFRVETEHYGAQWLIEKIQEQVKIKKSLSEATKKLAGAKTTLKMRKK